MFLAEHRGGGHLPAVIDFITMLGLHTDVGPTGHLEIPVAGGYSLDYPQFHLAPAGSQIGSCTLNACRINGTRSCKPARERLTFHMRLKDRGDESVDGCLDAHFLADADDGAAQPGELERTAAVEILEH